MTYFATPDSSNLNSVTYLGDDAEGEEVGTLRVEFASGAVYHYEDVPAGVFRALREAQEDPAKSVGSLFRKLVMLDGYTYEVQS